MLRTWTTEMLETRIERMTKLLYDMNGLGGAWEMETEDIRNQYLRLAYEVTMKLDMIRIGHE